MAAFPGIWQRSLCAVTGAIAGGITGLVFGLLQGALGRVPLCAPDVLGAGLLLGGFSWLVALVVVGLWLHHGLAATAAPALITSLLTALLTVGVSNRVLIAPLSVPLGLLIGTLVGMALCRLCEGRWLRREEARHVR